MKIYVYLDESGSIHKNSRTKYFAVGGYFAFQNDKNKITSLYKKINKEIKENRTIDLNKELKSYDMTDDEKIRVFEIIQDIDTFYGCVKIFEKKSMKKEIIESNIFFNYAVKILFKDCIVPLLNLNELNDNIEFIVSIDNRNIRIGDLNNLETYLKTEFCLESFDFKITYYDSSTNFGIQLADLTVNTFYNSYKDIEIVKKVIPTLKSKNFRISLFPGHKIKGRKAKIAYNIVGNS
ncbi:MAG: DUF3800 domain-containing protein [Clostridium sp.]|nr:DUF3800 domain-containing protein [Clostridium sp.]MCM1444276.1 DUF3800 domain-containing protein [Candidatus Amulumruptor caecigallinarius]